MENGNSNTYTQNEMKLQSGRHAWFYLISTPIGHICIIDYEQPSWEIKRKVFTEDYEKAEAYYKRICKQMIDGRI